ncbi:MAG: UTP--glucose-1-phosphate uridylyltransferase GalU [Alphaproteobacteria bacterium]
MPKPIRKAVFPVGGYGTRFLPATKAMPKEMLPLLDKPLIQYAVEEALASGIEELIFVTGRGKTAIEDHFDRSLELEIFLEKQGKTDFLHVIRSLSLKPGQVSYVRQQEPLGLGHAVGCARSLVGDEPFAVLLADDFILNQGKPCLQQMIDVFTQTGSQVLAVMDVPREETSKYGVLDPLDVKGQTISLKHIVEKPSPHEAPSTWAVVGRYLLKPEIFDYLAQQDRGAGGEIQLTDAIAASLSDHPTCGFRFEGMRLDCGNKEGMLEATIRCALNRSDFRASTRQLIHQLACEQMKEEN